MLYEAADVVGREDSPEAGPLVVEREDELAGPPARLQGGVRPEDVARGEGELVHINTRVPASSVLLSERELVWDSLVFSHTVRAGGRGEVEVV